MEGKYQMTKANLKHFIYTCKHKRAYLKVEKALLGKNTLSGYLHDVDKLFLYLFTPLSTKTIKKIHCRIANHQIEYKGKINWTALIVDWECSRLTKKDKQQTAYEWLLLAEPQAIPILEPLMEKLGVKEGVRCYA